jgi:hypothetical protein
VSEDKAASVRAKSPRNAVTEIRNGVARQPCAEWHELKECILIPVGQGDCRLIVNPLRERGTVAEKANKMCPSLTRFEVAHFVRTGSQRCEVFSLAKIALISTFRKVSEFLRFSRNAA